MGKAIIVFHAYYGCDTGCCGHVIRFVTDDDDLSDDPVWYDWEYSQFHFDHPSGDPLEWAKAWVEKEFGKEHVADLDWEHSRVLENC